MPSRTPTVAQFAIQSDTAAKEVSTPRDEEVPQQPTGQEATHPPTDDKPDVDMQESQQEAVLKPRAFVFEALETRNARVTH
eukprot:122842-Amphidinium_carterae.1